MNERDQKKYFKDAVDHRLSGLQENPFLAHRIIASEKGDPVDMRIRKKVSTAFVLAILISTLLAGTVAYAAVRLGVLDMFTIDGESNESAASGVQIVDASYEGNNVCFTVNDALYDVTGQSYAIGFTIENLTDADDLYVVCESITFDGQQAHMRSMMNVDEYILPKGITEGAVMGELPEGAKGICEMKYTFLRGLYPYEELPEEAEDISQAARALRNAGKIPLEPDGYVLTEYEADKTYLQMLLASGQFEIADTFTLQFELDSKLLEASKMVYSGQAEFEFDDYELRINSAYTTAISAHIEVAYITSDKPKDGGKGFGPLWGLEFDLPDKSTWTGNAGGRWDDPVQMEDGRYMSVYHYEALELFTQPDTLIMTLVEYDDNFKPTVHNNEAVTLHFTK